jgi:S1-C subfamily serine protease
MRKKNNIIVYFLCISIFLTLLGKSSYALEAACHNFTLCKEKAARGDSEAEYKIAVMYDLGEGISSDPNQAYAWYLKAANHGHKIAEFRMGEYYSLGKYVPRDYKMAAKWYQKSLSHGHIMANSRLWQLAKLGHIDYGSAGQNVKGTGFYINNNQLVTNFHVAHQCARIELINPYFTRAARVIYSDEYNDLAILKSDNSVDNFLTISNDAAKEWDEVFVASSSGKELKIKPTKVIHPNITQKERIKNKNKVVSRIKLVGVSNSGDSGSPLLSDSGEVIGVLSGGVRLSRTTIDSEVSYDVAIHLSGLKLLMDSNKLKYNVGNDLNAKMNKGSRLENSKLLEKSIVEVICVH